VTATSQADATKSATAQLSITSDIGISIAPPNASVELGAAQAFHAAITSAGHPDTSVRWSLSGTACPTACGSVDLNGNYTAPGILPSATAATLTAQSVADPSEEQRIQESTGALAAFLEGTLRSDKSALWARAHAKA
jgi:hypothetical protein